MNCREMTDLLADYLDKVLPQLTQDQCNHHLTSCADCAAYLASYRVTIRIARSAFHDESPVATDVVNQLIERLQAIVHDR